MGSEPGTLGFPSGFASDFHGQFAFSLGPSFYLYKEGAGIEGKWIWYHILLWWWQQITWAKKYIEAVFRLSRTKYLLLINDVCSGHGMEKRCCVSCLGYL